MTIETTVTAILAASQLRSSQTVVIQNTGSVNVSLGIGSENVAALTYANGVLLEPGASIDLTGNDAAKAVSGITESATGNVRANII